MSLKRARRSQLRGGVARARRRGFSLVELLITIAIIAALVGLAVPLFDNVLAEVNQTKVQKDLEDLKSAIRRFERERGFLGGDQLTPLEGAALTVVPRDPWGNRYLFDGNIGAIGTFAADSQPFGIFENEEDILFSYKPFLVPVNAFYQGPFGVPGAGATENVLQLTMNKPYAVASNVSPAQAAGDFEIWQPGLLVGVGMDSLGFFYDTARSKPNDGQIILACCVPANPNDPSTGGYGFRIDGSTRIDFGTSVIAFFEEPAVNSPFYDDPLGLTFGPQPWSPSGGGLQLAR